MRHASLFGWVVQRRVVLMQVLQRILNARQFSLKLIANVTYGYTAAGFSGRMPMAELADSIVQVTLQLYSRNTIDSWQPIPAVRTPVQTLTV